MVQARVILWVLTSTGFAINYLVCINLNIAIVEMIATPPMLTGIQKFNAINQNVSLRQNISLAPRTITQNQTSISENVIDDSRDNQENNFDNKSSRLSSDHGLLETSANGPKQFHWDEHEQALILGAFFWTFCITQIPGGILARRYGTKLIFGLSNVISCWLCFLMPMAAKSHTYALIAIRLLQGLLSGTSWPAMHDMAAKWIPPNERSKFITAYYGSSIGVAVFYPLFAYVMYLSSWEWTFHISGAIGSIWWFAWLYFVYDTPAQHPRIAAKELDYIENSLKSMVNSGNKFKIPWVAILTSSSVWINVIGHFGGGWGLFTLMTQTPTYFKMVHNWDIRATGFFSGLPHLLRALFAFAFSLYADYLLRNDKMSRTNVRKFATIIGLSSSGIFVLALAFFGTERILAITFITLATLLQGASSSGPLSSMIDIAPNYAGIILGICGTIGCMPGFMSSYTVGVFTLNNQTFEAWKMVFLICTGVLFGCSAIYISFADSTLKPWNDYSMEKDREKRAGLMPEAVERSESINANRKS